MTSAPLACLAGAHLGGSHQLDRANGARQPIDRMLAAVDAGMPDALSFDPEPVAVPQLVNAIGTLTPAGNSADVSPAFPRATRAASICATRPCASCSGPPSVENLIPTTSLLIGSKTAIDRSRREEREEVAVHYAALPRQKATAARTRARCRSTPRRVSQPMAGC